MRLSDSAKRVGVTDKTAWQWWTAGHLEADPLPTGTLMVREPQTAACSVALDARVSSAEQQEDAVRPPCARCNACGRLRLPVAPCGSLWLPVAT
jgi:predicted site-specific integrase-resolvase